MKWVWPNMCVCACAYCFYFFLSNLSINSFLIGIYFYMCACERYKVSFFCAVFLFARWFGRACMHYYYSYLYKYVLVSQSTMQILSINVVGDFCFFFGGKKFRWKIFHCNNEPHGSDTDQATKFPFIVAFICINEKQ